jgi:hypothetical protein
MGNSIGQHSNVWGLVQPQRYYFTFAVPARSKLGLASCLHPADQPIGRRVDVDRQARPPGNSARKTSFWDFARSAVLLSRASSRSELGSPIPPIGEGTTKTPP